MSADELDTSEEREQLARAMYCAEQGSATHWPTVAAILRAEILRLQAYITNNAPTPRPRNVRPAQAFAIAHCLDCEMKMPFYHSASDERDRWSEQHAAATGHTVEHYEELTLD